MLQTIADAAGDLMDTPFVAIWIANESREIVERVALRSTASDPAPAPRPFRYREGLVDAEARERRTIHIADVATDPRVVRREWLLRQRVRSVLAVPLIAVGGAFGSLVVADLAGRTFEPREVRLAQAFADQAAPTARCSASSPCRTMRCTTTARRMCTSWRRSRPGPPGQRLHRSRGP